MARRQALLVWLLAALMFGAGMPMPVAAATNPARASCCAPGTCHCDEQALRDEQKPPKDCGCARPTTPQRDDRAPRAPAPRGIEQIQLAVAPQPEPIRLPHLREALATRASRTPALPPGVLPLRSRQEVFSVWRC